MVHGGESQFDAPLGWGEAGAPVVAGAPAVAGARAEAGVEPLAARWAWAAQRDSSLSRRAQATQLG